MKVKENPQADNVRQMYSLAEAAALIGNSVSHILSLGGDGHLPIYARIPEDIQAYRTNDALLGRNNGIYAGLLQRVHIQQFASGIRPRLLSDATFLLLHPNTCRLVAAHGEAYQLDFPGAFRFSEELDLTLIDQPRTGMGTNAVDIGTEFIVCYLRNREPFILGMPTDATPVSIAARMSQRPCELWPQF